MMQDMPSENPGEHIEPVALSKALGDRYLAYALSTIMARSLPDVRDGLKPVHRRLLYAMRQLKLDPQQGFKKCARVVGDVIGKYHPHGEVAVYDAMVRLAQSFAVRFPLVDGQGNFGNIDGDNAAAMRYTEARLTAVAAAMLQGIDDNAVDFRATYDGEESEPVVLPARFPNLLANGASGIAVGMATSIPPHNVGEICDALLHLIARPKAEVADLVTHLPGPDFPTGGVIVEPSESILEAYCSGRGSFRVRARWEVERQKHGQYLIVVDEIPYQVQKSKVIERIATLLGQRKLALLADVRDESDENVRIVLEPKSRVVEPETLMESLFRATDLEVRISLNMNVVDANNVPRVMDLKDVLQAFLEHRHEVLLRTTRHRLAFIEKRLAVLDGYLIAYLNLDEVIRIIREEDHPKQVMMARWGLSDIQVEAILNMRLRALRKLEEIEIRREHGELSAEQADLEGLLANEKRRWRVIAEEVRDIRRKFGANTPLGRRRSEIGTPPEDIEIPSEALVEREAVVVLCSAKGWIRAVKGPGTDAKYKDGDRERFVVSAETTDKLLALGTNGRFFTLDCHRLPRGRGFGEPLRLMVDLGNDVDVAALFVHRPGKRRVMAATDGRGFLVEEDAVVAQTRNGKQVLNVAGQAEAFVCAPADGDTVAVVGENRKLTLFPLEEMPVMTRGRGVILQRYRQCGLSDLTVFTLADGLSWRSGERQRTQTDLTNWLGRRGNAGRLAPHGFPRSNKFI
jgi:topoisomerase-4 subunit A